MATEGGESAMALTAPIKKRMKRNNKGDYDDVRERTETIGGSLPSSFSSSFSLVPCQSRCPDLQICFWGQNYSGEELDWFILKVSLDCVMMEEVGNRKQGRRHERESEAREVAAFQHQYRHEKDPSSSQILSPVLSYKRLDREGEIPFWGNSWAFLGSSIYSIGGRTSRYNHNKRKDCSASVHYFDTKCPGEGWKRAPSMINPRYEPQVVALNDKLYVFGCFGVSKCKHKPKCGVWAEVFDPNDRDGCVGSCGSGWRILPNPPPEVLQAPRFLVVTPPNDLVKQNNNNNKKILVTINHPSYLAWEFDVSTNCWTIINCRYCFFGLKSNIRPPILVDNIMYWVDEGIHACDIRRETFYAGPVQDLLFQRCLRREEDVDIEGPDNAGPALLHLGGCYFCLLSFSPDPTPLSPSQRFHCMIVKVSRTKEYRKEDGRFFLDVSVLSCQSRLVDRERFLIDGRMLL